MDQRLQWDVAGFCHKHCTETKGQVIGTRLHLANMKEGIGKAGSCMDFQHDLRQFHKRQRARDILIQADETLWSGQIIQTGDNEPVVTTFRFNAGCV